MTKQTDSVGHLVEMLKRKAPETLDLLVAESDYEFEKAFDSLLDRAIRFLEQNKASFAPLGEDGLSSALALALSMPGLTVIREAHSNGHVDLTIEADHCMPVRRKLAEAKMYDGPAYHMKGLEQLLCRYTTGREGRGLIIEYVRSANIAGLLLGVRTRMDEERPCKQQGAAVGHVLQWAFITTHTHDSGGALEVSHVGCNLHVP